jgi:hypothetical protein
VCLGGLAIQSVSFVILGCAPPFGVFCFGFLISGFGKTLFVSGCLRLVGQSPIINAAVLCLVLYHATLSPPTSGTLHTSHVPAMD